MTWSHRRLELSRIQRRRFQIRHLSVVITNEAPTRRGRWRSKTQKSEPEDEDGRNGYLDGQLLLAMPGMPDDRFARSVIYLCAHSDEGAMGIIINRPASEREFLRTARAARSDRTRRGDPAAGRTPAPCRCSKAVRSRPGAASCSIPTISISTIRPCRSTRPYR